MTASKWIRRIALALATAVIAVPVAQARSGGQTEANGFLKLNAYLVSHGSLSKAEVARLGGITEAKGFLAIERAAGALAPDLGGRTEAKGFTAITRYAVQQGTQAPVASPSTGFAWGDAGIGAGVGATLFLIGIGGAMAVRRRVTTVELPQ
jgi:hypothetical protein